MKLCLCASCGAYTAHHEVEMASGWYWRCSICKYTAYKHDKETE